MEISDTIIKTLKLFGMTLYQIQTYITLIQSYEMKAQEIIDATTIPKSKVYQSLEHLVENGWVKKNIGRPMTFEAIHYKNLFERKKESLLENISLAEDELNIYWELREADPFQGFLSIRNKTTMIDRTISMLSRAKNRIFFAMGNYSHEEMDALLIKLNELLVKGIAVRLMIFRPMYEKMSQTFKKKINRFNMKLFNLPNRVLLIDNKEILMALPLENFEPSAGNKGLGIYMHDEFFSTMFEQSMNMVWNSS